ncbi:type VI secretion system-associated protein TagO [Pelagibacterium xiamenense]|uniref:type VI secretion system-associated protein TagO n=1 Tax=Pelagibacterium xiamenense TaxID=2901140 RepID=UPI001E5D1A1A|nr:type VI secretion system-associated protein TagO [Pelagibacterium xiamenense]MCD7059475.1 type VI secretion protein [Pelagibacterium xiamenense]
MRRAILAAATAMIAIFHTAPVAAQQFTPEQCAAIGPASERLDCYDSIFRTSRFTGGEAGQETPDMGLWASGIEVSQIEGTERPFASLESEQLIPAQPRGRAPARLTVLCQDGQPVVQFSFAGQFMGTETSRSGLITIQFDRQPPRSQSLDLSADRMALGFFSEDDARGFIDRLLVTNRLIVRAQPQGERSVTVSFQIEGIEQALQPVREACGW